jgi:hypothetical protein
LDDNDHGTHVAGTIGAVGNNGLGVVGVNWQVKLMALKFLDADGAGTLADAVTAIDYVVDMKNRGVNVRVANNSWGGAGYSAALEQAIARARDAGIIFVVAAGNDSTNNDEEPSYPASYSLDNMVTVAAIDSEANLADFSNYGEETVEIAAPGVNILSSVRDGGYDSFSGTSMATPHVVGALALLFAYAPGLSNAEALQRLYQTAAPRASLSGLVAGSRALNVARLLNNDSSPVAPLPSYWCQYGMSNVAYNPDQSADQNEIALQADEFEFLSIDLPFLFPFQGQLISTIYVSPNGVVYTKHAPSDMDYQNAKTAPHNSIAALHTDLLPTKDNHGIRYALHSDHVTISWLAGHYEAQNKGEIAVRLSLYADGTIEDFVELKGAAVKRVVKTQATIGLSASSPQSAFTYAANNARIANYTAVRFTPYCNPGSESQVKVTALQVNNGAGRKLREVKPGASFKVVLNAEGQGEVAIQASLNQLSCPSPILTQVSGGTQELSGKLPQLSAKFKNVSFQVAQVKASAKIKAPAFSANQSALPLSERALAKACSELAQAFE